MKRRVVLPVAAILALAAPASAAGPFGSVHVGQWSGGAYTNDATGKFSGCVAGAPYQSGIYFMVIVQPNGEWGLGFTHPSWRLQPGQAFPIDLTFDGRDQFHVYGRVGSGGLVVVPMPAASSLVSQFRGARQMSAVAQGQLFQFNLNGTAVLLPTLVNCVRIVNQRGLKAAGDFTLKLATPQTGSAPVSSSLRADAPNASPGLQIEAIELASNFILRSGLRNPRVLNREETPASVASFGAAWRSDEATGLVRIIPSQGETKGLDVAAAVVAADAKECKGKFASGRMSELVDSDVVFRGFASCEDSDGARLAHYFIVPRRKGGFVMFSVVSDMKADASKAVTKDEQLVGFQKAALVAVTQ
ncbi:MAG TPA: hypothetical protein VFU97_18960 [Xanthobacteraceae bacterium]|jgi:hypothetical protein|nr:hypothetical protein [Xanthobacteraceae bacterium]